MAHNKSKPMKLTRSNPVVLKCLSPALVVPLLGVLLLAGSHAFGKSHQKLPRNIPENLQVPAGQSLAYQATGVGVQIYVWTVNPTNAAVSSWVFRAPHAVLFASQTDDAHDVVSGIHFAGPTWQSNDGSKVGGARIASAIVDSNAVPWLLLRSNTNSGVGVLSDVTYIQRLNTVGGLAPSEPGTTAGQEVLTPYIADYYFYHSPQ
jgi:hypothetical protein